MPPPPPPAPNQQQPNAFFNTVLNNPSSTSTSAAQQQQTSAHTPPRRQHHHAEQPTSTFTATQRSLQARNKNYNVSPGDKGAESYEQRQKRDEAACILESSEMLIWYAAARNESIPQTRHHYQNIVLGISDIEDVAWREEWEVSAEEREREYVPSPGRSAKGKEKVRKRV